MTPLALFLILGGILVLLAVFNWRGRFQAAKEYQEEQAREAEVRREGLGPDYKTGSGKPEPELKLYEPPDDYVGDPINPEASMDQVDAALEQRDRLMLDQPPIGGSGFGGLPDLPPTVPWPIHEGKKLPFLAQIDLYDLPKSLLPSEGRLHAFGLCSDEGNTPLSVFHCNGPRAELVRAAKPAKRDSWPDWGNQSVYGTVPVKPDSDGGWEEQAGQLFGNLAEDEGGAGNVADGAERSGDDWITLLVSSTGSMTWSDCGWFHIVIRRPHRQDPHREPVLCSVPFALARNSPGNCVCRKRGHSPAIPGREKQACIIFIDPSG